MSRTEEKELVNGILLVNKPPGLTSNAVLQQVKRLYRAKKAGHTGSLDPMATGMLPICFGEATKFSQYLLDADKCYEVTGHLGIKTDTGDAMGEIIATVDDFNVSIERLNETLSHFRGSIKQIPPMYSALKHKGQPLYKYARAGVDIERKERDAHIRALVLNHFDGKQLALTVVCSKGTYIRTLIEDIGEALNVGGHVVRLHRSYTAGFDNAPMYTIEELKSKSPEALTSLLLPTDSAIQSLPRIVVDSDAVLSLRQGKMIHSMTNVGIVGAVRLYENDKDFFGLGELDATGLLKVKRLLSS